ncbi:glycosyltransferase family 39 protein [Candidatus Daviesbacteria bacterium]|nr:glycosyltransferase family 39 protein [Candidatus Daviesbacteria bacterium]
MIWAILLLGLILRLISLDQSLWLDEAINVLATQKYSFAGMITEYAKADFHPPGFFIILWFWTKLFGYSEIAVRIPSVIFGVVTIGSIYLIGKKLHSRKAGLIAALLLSINPLHIYYSQEARMYALATLAVSINMFLVIKFVREEKFNLIFLAISNLAVLASDYVAYFIFPAQAFFLLMIGKKEIIRKWTIALVSALALGLWWLPVFLNQLNVGSIASANLPTWKFVAGAFDFKTLPLTFVKFIIGRINLSDKLTYAAVLLPLCTLWGYLLLRGVKSWSNSLRKLLIVWIVIPLALATLISFVVPVYNYFRVLYVLPAFIILLSLGILSFESKKKYIFLSAVVLIELFCALVYLLNPAYQREDWKGLVNYFENLDSIILFESSGTLPPFDYYAKGRLKAKGALKDFPIRDERGVVDLEDGEKDVYLVDYLVQISDPDRLVAKKLTGLGYNVSDTKDFRGVGFVYHYTK